MLQLQLQMGPEGSLLESAKKPLKELVSRKVQAPLKELVQRSEQEPKVVASCQAAADIQAGKPSVAGSLEDRPVAGNLVDTPAALAFRVALDTLEDSPLSVAQDNPWAADSPADNLAEGSLVALASQAASDIPEGSPSAGSQHPEVEQKCRLADLELEYQTW